MDIEQLTDNGAGHLVIASPELSCLDFQAQRADAFLADLGNLAEFRQKPSDCGLVRPLSFPAPSLSEGRCGWSFLWLKLGHDLRRLLLRSFVLEPVNSFWSFFHLP